MTSTIGRESEAQTDRRTAAGRWMQVAAVFLVFAMYSVICRPVPSVNEPHYLGKARHYWQPQWCAGDLFLESSNPHLVFYQTVGALTEWLSLPQAAWVGRVMALLLLAWSWTRLMSKLAHGRWAALSAACLFLLLQAMGNFSGEWLVGGVESKVFAYAFAFAGWASLLERRMLPVGVWLGLSLAIHPVVGGWCVIATAMAEGWRLLVVRQLGVFGWPGLERRQERNPGTDRTGASLRSSPGQPTRPRRWLPAVGLLVLCSLPGMIPAVESLFEVDPAAAALADRYQVGTRLAHHLDPMAFPVSAYRYYGLLVVVWLLLRSRLTVPRGSQWFTLVTIAAVVIAAVGFVVGWGPRPIQEMPYSEFRVWLLKFYPFRLADVLVPMLVAVTMGDALRVTSGDRHRGGRLRQPIIAATALVLALSLPNVDKNPSRMSAEKRADWLDVCEWIRQESPADALLYAANEDWAVKWFAHRAEYVNYKDCPQDAAGILEWVRRLQTLNRWHRDAFRDGRISSEELAQLHGDTGITLLLVSRLGPMDAQPIYRNDSFRVYSLTKP